MESHREFPWKMSYVYFPMEIPWGMKSRPLYSALPVSAQFFSDFSGQFSCITVNQSIAIRIELHRLTEESDREGSKGQNPGCTFVSNRAPHLKIR